MQYLEVRRHTMRIKPGQHLSQAGVNLARRVGDSMGPFDKVITSTVPRAFETAIAMGFAVDEQYEQLSSLGDDVDAEIEWSAGFAEFARVVRRGKATARFAHMQLELWRSIVAASPDDECALIITHGGIVEAGAVACLPDADHSAWGTSCGYCEGVRLSFDGGDFTGIKVLQIGSPLLV
ncbi:histidine phosphatase family protein [Candidatus Poribacteria bacterium]